MYNAFIRRLVMAAVLVGSGAAQVQSLAAEPGGSTAPTHALTPAPQRPQIGASLLLDVALAGKRLVAVGEGGTVALSDDGGKTFRRAQSVPVQATLTSVSFVDERHGWAAGHWGVVLATQDGGNTWQLQRQELGTDQPLFDIHFSDAKNGLAVGLWSLMLRTTDGGAHWEKVKLESAPGSRKADQNLFHIFERKGDELFVTAEAGQVLHSKDKGATWQYRKTGYKGSLWTGVAAGDGALLVAGLSGTLMRSDDDGASWKPIKLPARQAITALTLNADGSIIGCGLEGMVLRSADGQRFDVKVLEGQPTLTSVVTPPTGQAVFTSKKGILHMDGR